MISEVQQWLDFMYPASADRDERYHVGVLQQDAEWYGQSWRRDQVADAVARAEQSNPLGVYLGACTYRSDAGNGRKGVDTAWCYGMWSDLDINGPGHKHDPSKHEGRALPPDEEAARKIVLASGLPEPTAWIHSGGGLYAWWLLITPVPAQQCKDLARQWQAALARAAAALGWHYGTGVSDLTRVLRVPGTVNRKDGLARPCRILSANGPRYIIGQLLDHAARVTPTEPPKPAPAARKAPAPSTAARENGAGISPLDDFNERATWAEILEPYGWECRFTDHNGAEVWSRPGGTSGRSADCGGSEHPNRMKAWSDSAGLPTEGTHSKAFVWAALRQSTPAPDLKQAAQQLRQAGYGQRSTLDLWMTEAAASNTAGAPAAGGASTQEGGQPVDEQTSTGGRSDLDVGNPATMADWLRFSLGKGLMSGMFVRGPDIVHTPREGENGYVPLDDNPDNNDGPAQVRVATHDYISARVQYTFSCYKLVKRGEDFAPVPAMFPTAAARTAVNAVDMLPNLRRLRGVIHTPVFRADGSLIEAPGYDRATKLLYLPEPGLELKPVPERPTVAEVSAAVGLVDELLAGFPFVSEHHRANYIGALVTPLLRALTPPPYKLIAIGAHQRGSGKTKLAKVSQIIHGGVFRSEMPEDDAELRKQVTSVLSHTTGPVVVFDNVSGVLRSSTLAGLLTSDQWGDRPLGATAWVGVPNDRLWIITGNNLNLGGDIPRRTVSADIDPGVPRPELRTGFTIGDPEVWAKARRADLMHALLTIVRAWVAGGMPLPVERASDGYAKWARTIEGILTFADVGGIFDHPSTQVEVGGDDDEWGDFLAAVHRVKGESIWTTKELLTEVDAGHGLLNPVNPKPIPLDALPGELADKAARSGVGPMGITRPLGMWLKNRDGRWAGALTVRAAGKDRDGAKKWRIQSAPGHVTPTSAGTAETAETFPAHHARVNDDLTTSSNGFVGTGPTGARETSPQSPQSPQFPRFPVTSPAPSQSNGARWSDTLPPF